MEILLEYFSSRSQFMLEDKYCNLRDVGGIKQEGMERNAGLLPALAEDLPTTFFYPLAKKMLRLNIFFLLCTLPGRRPGIAEGNERTRLGRVHLYFFRFCTYDCVVGY